MKYETLRWHHQQLELLDQRALPLQCNYIAYQSAAEVAQGIRDLVVRGAPAIGVAAAYGVAVEAQRLQGQSLERFISELEAGFDVLAKSRPTAVNLFWALDRMRSVLEAVSGTVSDTSSRVSDTVPDTPPDTPSDTSTIAQALLQEAHNIYAEDIAINRAMGAHGQALLKDGARVLTHCNAGALATAGHGTALGVFRSAVEAGKKISVIADETRPVLQGARLTAWELMQSGIPVTLITDNMAGHMMAAGEIDAVVVGTDRVAANGDVANKIGTYMVAVLAHRHGIPFYVACPLSTIDMTIESGADIPIEERHHNEVTGYGESRWAPPGVMIRNPAFDVTPAELVTGLITEKGVVLAPNKEKLSALF
ncbi:S-methyl-5-thioribose-1-phosphate isomerase [beta proteobacterium MWH-UniP1]